MARKFVIAKTRVPLRKQSNRCILCGRSISQNQIICSYCAKKEFLRRLRK